MDFGNACWTYKQFTTDVQTRQYRYTAGVMSIYLDWFENGRRLHKQCIGTKPHTVHVNHAHPSVGAELDPYPSREFSVPQKHLHHEFIYPCVAQITRGHPGRQVLDAM